MRRRPAPLRKPETTRRGFTLAEMLVIIGIILLVMAIALPAFTVIVSSRSVESARNVVASSLVRARGEAIRRGQPCGVFFYVDPDTGRSGLALVTLDPLVDPDPYKEYQAFHRGPDRPGGSGVTGDYQGGTLNPLSDQLNEPAMTADRVLVLAQDGDPALAPDDPANPYPAAYHAFNGRPIVIVSEKSREPPALSDPGDTGAGSPNPPREPGRAGTSLNASSFENIYWSPEGLGGLGTLELISGIDPILLPSGAALQVILGDTLQSSAASPAGDGAPDDTGFKYSIPGDGAPPESNADFPEFIERYARAGLVLFDEEGNLVQADYRIDRDSKLGRTIGLDLARRADGSGFNEYLMTAPLRPTVLGVVVYERDGFQSAASDGTALVWKGGLIATLAEPTTPFADFFRATEGDVRYPYPPGDRPTAAMTEPVPAGTDWRFHEYAEERWLDANTIPLMINRYSGTLTEAE